MIGFGRHAAWRVVALAILLPCPIFGAVRAEDPVSLSTPDEPPPAAQPKPGEPRPAGEAGSQQKPKESAAKDSKNGGTSNSGQRFDPAVVSAGQAAFERSCTQCHDAARALDRTKDLAGWRTTVRRMAGKRGADIPTSDFESIAVYLASRNAASGGGGAGESAAAGGEAKAGAAAGGGEGTGFSTFATISPQWRGGSDHLQNNGFAPLAWVGASWQGKIVSVRATACIACHGVAEPGLLNRIEPVEAAARIDLSSFLENFKHDMKAGIDAGRFIVPFGAFSAQSDPSLYRTVSTPLIFNMGQRIFNQDLGFPVLPMPYADEGVNLTTAIPLCECGTDKITFTSDTYLVNGLIGASNDVDFLQSRDLLDNNNRVAGGARITLGDQYVRAGASWTTGRFNPAGDPEGLYYRIYGFDIQAHYKRLLRFQFEWARRDGDRIGSVPAVGTAQFSEGVYGYYAEAEARPWEKCPVSFLARYDQQTTNSPLPPPTSTLTASHFNVERVTLGINIEMWHQSLLMFNYERWTVPEPDHRTADVFGVRYTITF
jgi:hypothetical protein